MIFTPTVFRDFLLFSPLMNAASTAEYSIEPISESDLPQIVSIEEGCYPHPWSETTFRGELEKDYARNVLVRHKGEVAGYLWGWLIAGEFHIQNIATTPSFRRKGVARLLLNYLLHDGGVGDLERVFLEVRIGNQDAIKLYESYGFTVLVRRKCLYSDGEDGFFMEWFPS